MEDRKDFRKVRKTLGRIDLVTRTTLSTSLFDIMTITEMPRRMRKLKYRNKERYFVALKKETSPITQVPKAAKSKAKRIAGRKQARKAKKPEEEEEKKGDAPDEAEDSDFGLVAENSKVLKYWKYEALKQGWT